MTDIVGSNTWTSTVVGPNAGVATHTQVNDLGVGLANRTQWLRTRIQGTPQFLSQTTITSASLSTGITELSAQSWTAVPGMEVTLPNLPLENDLLFITAHFHVRQVELVTPYSEYAALALVTPAATTLPGSTARIMSVASDSGLVPIDLSIDQRVGPSPPVNTVALWATVVGSGKLVLRNPFMLRVQHYRPVAPP